MVILSDETKINQICWGGEQWSWHRDGHMLREQVITGTLKFGDDIMTCGYLS